MNLSFKENLKNAVGKNFRNGLKDTAIEAEEKTNQLYNEIISFFENRMHKAEDKLEDLGIIQSKTSTTKVVLGTLAGLVLGVAAAVKFQLTDVNIPVKDIKKQVKGMKLPVKETGKKVNKLYNNFSSYLVNRLHNVEGKMEDVGLIEKKNTGPGILLGLLAGLVVGGAAALLLAKDSGEEFREKVNTKFNRTKDQLIAKKDELMSKKDEKLNFNNQETEDVAFETTSPITDYTKKF
ncbi:MAG: YtxH domain-containing protein [Bacteroidota bacterium]|nr:YtxH domain-containing protein [Bacteroidota bacterium]